MKVRKEMDKGKQIAECFKASGKSQRVWCVENGVKRSTLRYWLERVNELSERKEIVFAKIVTGGEKQC